MYFSEAQINRFLNGRRDDDTPKTDWIGGKNRKEGYIQIYLKVDPSPDMRDFGTYDLVEHSVVCSILEEVRSASGW